MRNEILERIEKYVEPFRITKGKDFRLKDFDPKDTLGLNMGKGAAADLLEQGAEWLAEEQDMLYAQDRWSLLLVFQAMDADDEYLFIVRAVEDADAPAFGHTFHVAPQEVVVEFLRGRLFERIHLAALRVHARHHVFDGAVFTSRVHRLEYQQQ